MDYKNKNLGCFLFLLIDNLMIHEREREREKERVYKK